MPHCSLLGTRAADDGASRAPTVVTLTNWQAGWLSAVWRRRLALPGAARRRSLLGQGPEPAARLLASWYEFPEGACLAEELARALVWARTYRRRTGFAPAGWRVCLAPCRDGQHAAR